MDLAEDGEVAWQRVQERSYHCIILDLKMPGMSGQQLYRAIDALDREQARKVIFLTGDMVNPDTFDFVTGSGNPAFSKPVNLDELHRQVRITLELTREPIEEPTGSSVYPPAHLPVPIGVATKETGLKMRYSSPGLGPGPNPTRRGRRWAGVPGGGRQRGL